MQGDIFAGETEAKWEGEKTNPGPFHQKVYGHDPEALDWWWCLRCRQNKPKLSNAEKKNKAAAETTQNIQAMLLPMITRLANDYPSA